jgi:hypothetical protein
MFFGLAAWLVLANARQQGSLRVRERAA